VLKCAHNNLRELPVTLSECSVLEEVHANDNRIEGVPAEFGALKELRVLYLHNNRLTSLPSELGGIPTLEEARVPRRRRRARSKRSLTCLRAPCRTD
jgi:leucine-rich repeat protein SHOC2